MSALAVFALPLGRRPLANQDEARFGLLAREAVEHHRCLLRRVRGVIDLNKPPLYFWTVALLAKPFGVVNDLWRPVREVGRADELEALLAAPGPGDAIPREDRWAGMRAGREDRWQVLLADRVGRDRMVLLGPR